PTLVQGIHQLAPITRDRYLTLGFRHGLRQLTVFLIRHFEAVGFGVASGFVRVRRITVEQGLPVVVKAYYLDGGAIFDLNPEQSFSDLGKHGHAAQPARDDAGHPRPASVLAICPTSERSGLGQAGANLSRPNEEPAGAFQLRQW